MMLSKPTKALLNFVLILLIVFLIESLIGLPKNVQAEDEIVKYTRYKVVPLKVKTIEKVLNQLTQEGWRLIKIIYTGKISGWDTAITGELELMAIFGR